MSAAINLKKKNKLELQASQTRNAFWFTHRGYALRSTLRRFLQQKFASLLTLSVLGLSLSLPMLVLVLAPDIARLGSAAPQSPGIVIYLDPALNDIQGARLAETLQAKDSFDSATYVSKSEALELLGDDSSVQSTVDILGHNPLPGSVLLTPARTEQRQSVAEHRLLANTLGALPQVIQVEIDLEWVERLAAITRFARIAGWLSISVLAIACLMAISNTIRLEAMRQTRESRVVHLLGAANSFRRRPFVYLGALLGFGGAIAACLLCTLAIYLLRGPINSLAKSYAFEYTLPLPPPAVVLLFVICCTFFGMLAALISVRRVDPNLGN